MILLEIKDKTPYPKEILRFGLNRKEQGEIVFIVKVTGDGGEP